MNEINFVKMQGIGNDFVLIDSRKTSTSSVESSTVESGKSLDFARDKLEQLAIDMCDRHFGVGADGLIIVWPSTKADVRMQIFNSDGSEAEMCGNGIRCFAKYIYETSEVKKEVLSVETKAGIIVPTLIVENGAVKAVEVDMGIPVDEEEIKLQGFNFKKVSMGNPHAVTFVDNFDKISVAEIGPKIETDPHFKNKTNVEFIKIINDHEIELRVWERGVGETLACGTGACAGVAASNMLKKTGRRVLVHLPGGDLDIEWLEDGHILMRGPAERVFQGTYFSS